MLIFAATKNSLDETIVFESSEPEADSAPADPELEKLFEIFAPDPVAYEEFQAAFQNTQENFGSTAGTSPILAQLEVRKYQDRKRLVVGTMAVVLAVVVFGAVLLWQRTGRTMLVIDLPQEDEPRVHASEALHRGHPRDKG